MAIISLRSYIREIEEMIDNGHYDEALTHCRRILELYPKHVETYRLMAKALLESQRMADASDVFQRVLACIPDDFVSHLGMSIIREDEGNLDGAIWHMERAFEVHPSNAAVQAELRRLYGKRDGVTPQKIQLTRGALARISAKSALYTQAITELRTALAEDPERPDLQVLLAEMYANSGDDLAAIETCNIILNKLPYCFKANYLLAQLLPGTDRSADAHLYRERLEEIDPYAAHLSDIYQTSEQVPDTLVTLERYDATTSETVSMAQIQPDWTGSLHEEPGDREKSMEEVPEWLEKLTDQTPAEDLVHKGPEPVGKKPFTGAEIPESPNRQDQDEIPQWMKDIGWEPPFPQSGIAGDLSEPTESNTETGERPFEVDLPQVNIETSLTESLEDGSAIMAGSSASDAAEGKGVKQSEEMVAEEIPEWLSGGEKREAIEPGEEIPDWLQDLGEGLPEVIERKEALQTVEEIPDESAILREGSDQLESIQKEKSESLPQWLEEVFPVSPEREEDIEIARAEIPDWLRQIEEEFQSESTEPGPEESLSIPLELEAEELSPEAEEIPDWLVAAMSTDALIHPPTERPEETLTTEQPLQSDTQPVRIGEEDSPAIEEVPLLYQQQPLEPGVSSLAEEESLVEEISPLSQEIGALSTEDEEAALAWLENLAARQGAAEEELLTSPEERLSEMPVWIHEEATEETSAPPEEVEEEPLIESEPAMPLEEPTLDISFQTTEEIEEPEPFVWQPEIPEEQTAWIETEKEATPLMETEKISQVSAFEETRQEEGFAPETPQPEEELPDWLRDLETEFEQPSWVSSEEMVQEEAIRSLEEVEQKLDINAASLGQLERIPGIGFIVAQSIINYRETTGGFKSLDELANVPGLTPDGIPDLEKFLTVEVLSEAAEPVSDLPALKQAWEMLARGNIEGAVSRYSEFIKQQEHLDDVIRDLQEAVSMHNSNAILYQVLGDAYVRANRLQEALTAYSRAEDLLA